MAQDYEWRPIEDLQADWPTLADSELPAIRQVYADLKTLDPAATARWEIQARREWAIETGRLEGVYHWDRGTTETLMARGIIPDLIPRKGNVLEPEQIAAIINDAVEVLDGLFAFVKGDRPLSKSYIHELHQALLKNVHTYLVTNAEGVVAEQRLEKGVYKRYANSVKTAEGGRHAYCPPEHVEAEMDRLVEWHRRHVLDDVAPEVGAAWLHHRFTQIHPYPDGNGRVARALATLVLIKGGLFPLTIQGEERECYWRALLTADRGDLSSFVRKIRVFQGRDLVALSENVDPSGCIADSTTSVSDVIKAIQLDSFGRGQVQPEEWQSTQLRSSYLRDLCFERLSALNLELHAALGQRFLVSAHVPDTPANLGPSRNETVDLRQTVDGPTVLGFAFGQAGARFRGINQVDPTLVHASTPSPDPFLITYAEPQHLQKRRFENWLESAIIEGLKRWRETLRA